MALAMANHLLLLPRLAMTGRGSRNQSVSLPLEAEEDSPLLKLVRDTSLGWLVGFDGELALKSIYLSTGFWLGDAPTSPRISTGLPKAVWTVGL